MFGENKNIEIKKFAKIDQPFWRVNNKKAILTMAIPIFIQMLFSVFVAQINQIAMNYYDRGYYSDAVNKAIVCYFTLQFVPTLIASGTLIVMGNLIGQGRKKELSEVLKTGLVLNFFIVLFIFAFTQIFSENIINLLSPKADVDISAEEKKELMNISINYYRILNVQFLMLSIIQVFVAGLQALKKSIYVTIGSIISGFLNLVLILGMLFIFDLGPVWSATSLILTSVFLLLYMGYFCIKFIDFSTSKFFAFNPKFAKDTLKMGLPITMEMGTWFLFSFVTSMTISKLGDADVISNGVGKKETHYTWLVFHRNITSIQQYSSAFTSAMGTVTSVFVSRKIGEDDKEGAYREGINCWKLAIYASVISGIVMFMLTYPIMLAFNVPSNIILKWGFVLFGVLLIKLLFDTVNMTILRALWSSNDLWFPITLSLFTMGIGMVVGPLILLQFVSNTTNGTNNGIFLLLIYSCNLCDPLIRSLVYQRRWRKGTWQKYAKKI
ncbi:MATE family efflux transporter [Spiroplasma endosymbiont of Crioceris asparagi]|uniref:MATE family efflux transporter n=1 Tax=Spiroplasma endosymbiont of Crioceris asparagi TaxID=3066286 RepID=UPI0030CFFF17